MKKFLKITLLVLLAAGIIGTFVFLWMKSRPKVVVYETVTQRCRPSKNNRSYGKSRAT